jgi:hypothetical protein
VKRRLAIGVAAAGAVLVISATTMFGLGFSAASSYADKARSAAAQSISDAPVSDAQGSDAPGSDAPGSDAPGSDTSGPHSPPPVTIPAPTATPGTPGTDTDPFDIPASLSAEDQESARLWLQQYEIQKQCMAENGFDYTTIPPWGYNHDNRLTNWMSFVPADQFDAAWAAFYGDTGVGADYHWQDAGCAGYATHVMGNDDRH